MIRIFLYHNIRQQMKPICFRYQYILKASIERVSDLVILGMLVQGIVKPKFW